MLAGTVSESGRVSQEIVRLRFDPADHELDEAETVVDQADALVDAIYYICDTAVRHGMNLDNLFDIVHGANMAKVINGKVLRRDDGKIMKPENWEPPEPKLAAEIRRQCDEGSFS